MSKLFNHPVVTSVSRRITICSKKDLSPINGKGNVVDNETFCQKTQFVEGRSASKVAVGVVGGVARPGKP